MDISDPSRRSGARGPVIKSILRDVRVLVVDDICDNCEVVDYLLSSHGARVTVAASAAAGLLAMEADRFDVVVTDIGMPEEDGFDFLRQIREHEAPGAKQLPVIALTALWSREDRIATAEAGFHAHLSKPVEHEKLVRTIATLLGRCEPSQEGG